MAKRANIPDHIQDQMKQIGAVLRWLRKTKKLTLHEFKEKTQLSVGAIRNVENGEDAKISTVLQVCDQLGFDLSEFLKGSELLNLHEEQLPPEPSEFEQDWAASFSEASLEKIRAYKDQVKQQQHVFTEQIRAGKVEVVEQREYSSKNVPATIEQLQAEIIKPVRGNYISSSVIRKHDRFEAAWQMILFQKKVNYTVALKIEHFQTELGTPASFVSFELLEDQSDELLVDLHGFWCIEADALGLSSNVLFSTTPILFAPKSYRERVAVSIFGFVYPLSSYTYFKRYVQKAHAHSYM